MKALNIGEQFGGGIVICLFPNRRTGLVAYPEASDAIFSSVANSVPAGTTTDDFPSMIGAGRSNTSVICQYSVGNLQSIVGSVIEGYDDWYVPSKAELLFVLKARLSGALPNLFAEFLWSSNPWPISSSSNLISNYYWALCFNCSNPTFVPKIPGDAVSVALVRKF